MVRNEFAVGNQGFIAILSFECHWMRQPIGCLHDCNLIAKIRRRGICRDPMRALITSQICEPLPFAGVGTGVCLT